ncbi:MAG TPA: hypothetical protein VJR58_16180 [Vineibacter sp.]|nr:hypothetical protein [Vineibacter sp.]
MSSPATLVRTTQFGVRPLGVRGEPLHNTHVQVRDVVRRRLGDRHFHLLAEPQAHPATGRIDWYADGAPVHAAEDLPPPERDALRTEIDGMLADISRLGMQLETSTSEDAKLAGRTLQLAARRPDDDTYLFRVGEQPVLICWGYDRDTAGAILPPAFLASTTPTAPSAAPATMATPATSAGVIATAPATRSPFPWPLALLVGLLGLLLILGVSYGLRLLLPVPPELQVTELAPEPPSPPPPAPPDVTTDMKGAIDIERERESTLKAALAALRDEFQRRQQLCKREAPPPPEPPKPPPLTERKPAPKPEAKPDPKPEAKPEPKPEAPKPAPKPKVAETPKPQPPAPAPAPPPPPAPPVTQPPPGMMPCNVDAYSGGEGVTRNRHYLGSKPGPVTILYNMRQIPDQMNVYYRGRLVASTNQPVSYNGRLSFDYQPEAGDYSIVVEVVGPRSGTEWNYRVECPP